jgi:hypothetical protein
MTQIHYFPRYSQRENFETNNTLLLLRQLYNFNRFRFQKFLSKLLPEAITEAGSALELGLQIKQQVGTMGVAHVEFDQLRASELSGKTAVPPRRIVQIGAGTIGSLAAESLVREGFGLHWTFIDPDYLLPHNLARHDLGVIDVGMPKALTLASRIRALRTDVLADAIVADVLNPAEHRAAIAAAIGSADLVIDAAASVPVARFLSDQEGESRRASIFFNPAGTSVVLLVESRDRSINLRMLEAAYYGDILRVPELQDHLSQSAEAIPYAGACRAVTNRIPAGRAQILTGLVTTGLSQAMSKAESGLHVWTVSANGATMVHSPDVGTIRTVSCLGWPRSAWLSSTR